MSCSRLPVYSSLSLLKRCTRPFWSTMTMTELASDTTVSAKDRPSTRSLATDSVSECADAVPAHSLGLILRPTRWRRNRSPYSVMSMRTLEVMPVSARIAPACSGRSAVAMLAAPFTAANSNASLSAARRQYGLFVPKCAYRIDLSSWFSVIVVSPCRPRMARKIHYGLLNSGSTSLYGAAMRLLRNIAPAWRSGAANPRGRDRFDAHSRTFTQALLRARLGRP
ncbi:hypothetical protein FQZ97_706640 [compost metagenome]